MTLETHANSWHGLIPPHDLEFLRQARVGRLATIGREGFPSVVPICFALLDDPEPAVVSVLDEKPKQVPDSELTRVRNILRHPQVGLTIDRYEEDWSKLVFVQIRGIARLVQPDDPLHASSLAALRSKYPRYRSMTLAQRTVIAIADLRLRAWRAADVPGIA